MLRPLVELARGKNAPGRTISYEWSGYGTPGQIVASPYFGEVNVMIVARTAEAPVGNGCVNKLTSLQIMNGLSGIGRGGRLIS